MRTRSASGLVVILVFSLFFPWLAESASESRALALRVHYSANRQGEIEPCGCAINPTGGLGRMAQFLATDREAYGRSTLFVDSGDAFYSALKLNPSRVDQERLKGKLIAESFRDMALDAFTPGERDFALGIDELRSLEKITGAAFVSANLFETDGKTLLFPAFRVLRKGDLKVGITGAADEESFLGLEGVKATPALPALEKSLSALRSEGVNFIVVLSHLGLPGDRKIARLKGVSAVFGAHSLDALERPEVVAEVPIVQVLFQGRQIGVLDLDTKSKGNLFHRIVDLGASYDAPNPVTKRMTDHREAVRELALNGSVAKSPSNAVLPFVAHAKECRTCHTAQYDFWNTTKHASAYLVLFAKNQHFDPECIACHSLGFKEAGGFSSIVSPISLKDEPPRKKGETPFVEKMMAAVFEGDSGGPLDSRSEIERYSKLKKQYHVQLDKLEAENKIKSLHMGVQCEHCHGNRNGHPPEVAPRKRLRVAEASCRVCHQGQHDPTFDFAKKRKLVACPLIAGEAKKSARAK